MCFCLIMFQRVQDCVKGTFIPGRLLSIKAEKTFFRIENINKQNF